MLFKCVSCCVLFAALIEVELSNGYFLGRRIGPTGNDCYYSDLQVHPTNCSRFLQCSNNVEYEMECPKHLRFNIIMQVCDWKSEVTDEMCKGNVTFTTTEATETETTEAETVAPETTVEEIVPTETTEAETTESETTEAETTVTETTEAETTVTETTEAETTEAETMATETTDAEATVTETTKAETTVTETTEVETTVTETTEAETTEVETTVTETTEAETTEAETTVTETTEAETTEVETTQAETTTEALETTITIPDDALCKEEGNVPDPNSHDDSTYIQCISDGQGGFNNYTMHCPPDLYYVEARDGCYYKCGLDTVDMCPGNDWNCDGDACQGVNMYPDERNCTYFFTCVKDHVLTDWSLCHQRCPLVHGVRYVFSLDRMGCIRPAIDGTCYIAVNSDGPDLPKNGPNTKNLCQHEGTIPNPDDPSNATYIQCFADGQGGFHGNVMNCEPDLFYDECRQACYYKCAVDTVDMCPGNDFNCAGDACQGSNMYPDYGNCTYFFTCVKDHVLTDWSLCHQRCPMVDGVQYVFSRDRINCVRPVTQEPCLDIDGNCVYATENQNKQCHDEHSFTCDDDGSCHSSPISDMSNCFYFYECYKPPGDDPLLQICHKKCPMVNQIQTVFNQMRAQCVYPSQNGTCWSKDES